MQKGAGRRMKPNSKSLRTNELARRMRGRPWEEELLGTARRKGAERRTNPPPRSRAAARCLAKNSKGQVTPSQSRQWASHAMRPVLQPPPVSPGRRKIGNHGHNSTKLFSRSEGGPRGPVKLAPSVWTAVGGGPRSRQMQVPTHTCAINDAGKSGG